VLTIFTAVQRTTRYKPTHRSSNLVVLFLVMTPPGQTGRRRHYVLDLSVRSSVRPFYQTCKHDILQTNEMNRFWCQLEQVVHGAKAWKGLLLGSGGQRSRSHEAEYNFGGLAEASLSTSFGWVAFLVFLYFFCFLTTLNISRGINLSTSNVGIAGELGGSTPHLMSSTPLVALIYLSWEIRYNPHRSHLLTENY